MAIVVPTDVSSLWVIGELLEMREGIDQVRVDVRPENWWGQIPYSDTGVGSSRPFSAGLLSACRFPILNEGPDCG